MVNLIILIRYIGNVLAIVSLVMLWSLSLHSAPANSLSTSKESVVKIDEQTLHSIEGFFNGYEHFINANILLREMLSSQDPVEEYKTAVTLLNNSKGSKCGVRP